MLRIVARITASARLTAVLRMKDPCNGAEQKAPRKRGRQMPDRKITVEDAVALADIVRAAQNGARVTRITREAVFTGEARRIGTSAGAYAPDNADVRDLYLKIQDGPGFAYWRVETLMTDLLEGRLFIGPDTQADPCTYTYNQDLLWGPQNTERG